MSRRELRAKYLFTEVDERAGERVMPLLAVSAYRGVVPRTELTSDEPRADDLSRYKVCRPTDIVINRMSAYQGAAGVAPIEGLASPDYTVLRAVRGVDPRFLGQLIRSRWFTGEIAARLRGIGGVEQGNVRTPRINTEDLGNIRVCVPPLAVQSRIAEFLDTETPRIDALIEKKRLMTKLLQKRWRSAAVAAISCLMRDYGTVPLRRTTQCLDRKRIPLSAEERADRQGPFPYYGASTVVDWIDDYLFDEDLVLVGEDGAQLGDPEYPIAQRVSGKIWVNNHAHVLRPVAIDPDILVLHLNTLDRVPFISGATREKFTQDDLGRIPVPAAPIGIQVEAASELMAVRGKCDRITQLLEEQIALLAEHRQALITAAVTGQFDVPAAGVAGAGPRGR